MARLPPPVFSGFAGKTPQGDDTMADVWMVVLTLVLFAAAWVYIAVCDRL